MYKEKGKGGYRIMDLHSNRGARQPQQGAANAGTPQQPHPAAPNPGVNANTGGSSFGSDKRKSGDKGTGKVFNMKFASIALLFSATVLVIALIVYMAVGGSDNRNEARYIDDDAYQAVFLNGGQVYFGQATDLNNKYMRLADIYYLRVNQQVQPAEGEQAQVPQGDDISLVKLGCELHGPQDEMLINRDQVVFWENLKSDGDVTEAIAAYREENPDGQDCDEGQGAGAAGQQQTAPAGSNAPNDTDATVGEDDFDLEQ